MGRNVTVVGSVKKENQSELKKHAATIHCSNTLSLLQRKISNALLYHAYKDLMVKEEHAITIKQLCHLIGYQGHNHAAIKEALKGLITTLIEWNVMDDEMGTENWTASSIIASVSLEGPICYYAYSPRMKQLLHSPSIFGKIDLVIQSQFRSSYGLALYENCIRYRGLPHTKWFDLELFKKLMGVSIEKYDIFRDFKRRVIDQALVEVNTYSDLIIASEFQREGRKIVKLRFSLKERVKKTRLGQTLKENEKGIRNKLEIEFGLSKDQIDQLLEEYSFQFIQEKIKGIEASKPFQESRIQNLTGYLMSAIKNNYQLTTIKPISLAKIDKNPQHSEFNELKREVEKIRLNYNSYREMAITAAIHALEDKDRKTFMDSFFLMASPSINTILHLQKNKYTKETVLNSPQIQALLRQHALREFDFFSLISLEEFVSKQLPHQIEAWKKLKSYDPDHPLLRVNE